MTEFRRRSMGIGGISIWQLLVILAIVVFLFGTARLRNMGSDLGSAIKGFKKAMNDDDKSTDISTSDQAADKQSIEQDRSNSANQPGEPIKKNEKEKEKQEP